MIPAFEATSFPELLSIQTAGPTEEFLCTTGILRIQCSGSHGQTLEIVLPNSLMSEGFTANLISLRALLLEGYSVTFRLKYAVMTTPSGERIFLQVDNEGMWVFPWEIGVKNKSQPLF